MNIIEYLKTDTNIDYLQKLNTNEFEDGTYDIQTKQPISFKSGFQATFQQLKDNYTKKQFMRLIQKYANETDGKYYIGKFNNEIEVSFHFENETDAIQICKLFNQVSYWNWNTMDEIPNKYYRVGLGNDY
jgi:hypothetical protein